MRFLITGHTGFKGAWLTLLLNSLGHEVSGVALDPQPGSLYRLARVDELVTHDFRVDIRDASALRDAVAATHADVVVHLAAQALVRESYRDPRTTFETNAIGTLNVLEALGSLPRLRAALIITTDKVYRNVGRVEGYREDEPLGGADPYSASKAMADILTQSWVTSFPGVPTAVARAGNVIGGGDVSKDRLIVDLIAGFASERPASIRYPDAVRPWQHVLDCVSGYLTLVQALLDGRGAGEWNFGPEPTDFKTVREIADAAASRWGGKAAWTDDSHGEHLHEAALLTLDASKAQRELHWAGALPFPASLEWTVDWHRDVVAGEDPRAVTLRQIAEFRALKPAAAWLAKV